MSTAHTSADPLTDHSPSEQGGGHRAAALAVVVVSLGVAAAALALYAVDPPAWSADQWYFVVDLADAIVYAPVAFLLLTRSRKAVAWLVALTAVGGALAAFGFQWSQHVAERPDLPHLDLISSMQNWAWIPGTIALVAVVPWLVRDDRLDRRARIGVGIGVAVIAWFVVGRLTDPYPWPEGDPIAPLAVRSEAWGAAIESMFTAQIMTLVVVGLLATLDVVVRRQSRGVEARRGLGWLAVGVLLVTVSFVPLALPVELAGRLPVAATPLMHLASQLFYPAAILVVVLRQRLWGIDLAVSRAVTWGLLTALLTTAYVAVVSVLGLLLPGDSAVQQVVATAFVAAGFQPVKVWVQGQVNRLVHGDAAEPMKVMRSVSRQVGRAATDDELLDDVVAGIRASMRLGEVSILVGGDDREELLTSSSVDGARDELADMSVALELPLVVGQRQVGRLVARPRRGERLDGRTERSIEELTPIVAATVELSRTTAALTRSRAQLADARDAERRRLRRELHDGLGPALAGIGLALQASRNLLASDPQAAGTLIDQMVVETEHRVEEVRAMARDLLPPTLEAAGLGPALVELASLHSTAGIDVEVHPGNVTGLSSAAATAAYAIASEALRNAVRHSGAGRCTISLAPVDDHEMVLRIVDDGRGIDDTSARGVGLSSMQEWAEGVGGTLVVRRAEPTGTEVLAQLPILTEANR